jgi:hypothetical protein
MTDDLEVKLAAWMQSIPVSTDALAALRSLELPPRARPWPPLLRLAAAAAVVIAIAIVGLSVLEIGRAPIAAVPSPAQTPNAAVSASPNGSPRASTPSSASVPPEPESSPETSQANPASMAWFDRDHGLFAGSSGPNGDVGTVWRTSNGGRSWQSVTLPGGGLTVVTVGGTSAWAGSTCSLPGPCKNRLFRSEDGGRTWTQVATQPVSALAFTDARHGWAIAFGEVNVSDPSILETTDGGATWVPKPAPCPAGTGVPVALSFPSPERGWLACNGTVGAGSATKAILRTTDGGHWRVMAAAPWPDEGEPVGRIASSGYLSGISMVANGTGMYWADRGISERTADGGTVWTGMTATSFDVVIPSAGWAIDENDWLMYVWNGDLGRLVLEESTDGGATWSEAPGFVPPA